MSEWSAFEYIIALGVFFLFGIMWALDRLVKRLEVISDTLIHIQSKLGK